jgi:hypothetical protein
MTRFRGPVRRSRGGGFVLNLTAEEIAVLRKMLGELGDVLRAEDTSGDGEGGEDPFGHTQRLFPVAHPDNPEQEAEYQRLMRSELVASRLAAIQTVEDLLQSDERLDEAQLTAFMQSINAIRLVLGSLIGITDDEEVEIDAAEQDSPEHHLYAYLSWLLEWTVQALSGAL